LFNFSNINISMLIRPVRKRYTIQVSFRIFINENIILKLFVRAMDDTAWCVFFLLNPLEIFLGLLSVVQTRVVLLHVSIGNE